MKRIGIMGGSFDPVHFGHIQLAIALFEKRRLDEVWWIPSRQNPLKQKTPAADHHRLNMLDLALSDLPFFKILDIELKRAGPSFTIDTVRELKASFPSYAFFLLLGEDVLENFMEWKEPEALIQLAPPLIGSRSHAPLKDLKKFGAGITKTPLLDISATNIRKRLKDNLFCAHLVPSKVLDYIKTHGLYS